MTMPVTITATGDAIRIFKTNRRCRRDLLVQVRRPSLDHDVTIPFPIDRDVLEIPNETKETSCEVVIIHRKLLPRLRHPKLSQTISLQDKPLRLMITGSGRCGTKTLATFLNGMSFDDGTAVIARHETLCEYAIPALINGDYDLPKSIQMGMEHNVESAPYYAIHTGAIVADRVIHIIRDGRRVVQSGLNRGWYQDDSIWNRLKPQFDGDAFAKSCHLWRMTCENAMSVSSDTFRLEDLSRGWKAQRDFCRQLGIVHDGRAFPRSNRGQQPSTIENWTPEMVGTFTSIAGHLMDRFYPGWNMLVAANGG